MTVLKHRILFYDFEVFKHDWLVVIADLETSKKVAVINDVDKLKRIYEKHNESIWVGYNSRHYDQFIMKAILSGLDPWHVNDQIINNDKPGYHVVPAFNEYKLYNFDIAPLNNSLKQLEGFMGSTIKESSVPFNIDRKLTDEELDEVLKYCTHDVEQTIEVFKNRREEFDSQLGIIDAFNLPMELISKTKAQLAATVLGAVRQERNDEYDITFPDTLNITKYQHIVEWYKANKDASRKLQTSVAGVPHIFGWGGLHGALDNYSDEGIILCCDVASLYPSIMIEYGFLSRNVTHPDKYREIRDTRLRYKAEKNPLHYPLKIMLNSTFGASKDKHNDLFDPLMANNICVGGQLLLLDLIEKLEPYCKLIQSNTDGLFLKVDKVEDIDVIKQVANEWEQRVRLTLEWDVFSKIYQKDVNNYIIINQKGKYKSKGAYVKELNNIDYDLPIVNKALVNHFIKGQPVEQTINECNELREYQKIVKVSRLYKHAVYGESVLKERVIRVFASTDESAPGIFKVKDVLDTKTNTISERVEKIANTPPKCFIHNDSVLGLAVPTNLDKQYYIDVAKKRLSDFLDPKVKTSANKSDIKYVSIGVRDEMMEAYENDYPTFVDFLVELTENTAADTRQIEIMIKLNYFEKFGLSRKLLDIFLEFKSKYRKALGVKSKTERLAYLYEFESQQPDKSLTVFEQIAAETEYLGYITTKYLQAPSNYAIIISMEKLFTPKATVYYLQTGEQKTYKIPSKEFYKNNDEACIIGDILIVDNVETRNRKRRLPNGKFEDIEGQFEEWIPAPHVLKRKR